MTALLARRGVAPAVLQLVAFAALAAFCLLHYAPLVEPVPSGRALAVALLAAAAGAALAATAAAPRRAGLPLRIGIVFLLAIAALWVTGLEPRLLWPRNWDEIGEGLDRGLAGLDSFTLPYGDDDRWVRLTILLAMPLLAVPAAALAFWPARRGATARRVAALALLLVAYATGVVNLSSGAWALRGTALLLLVAAFLWLPRLRGREGLAGLAAVAGCAVAALPLAAGLDARDPWVDYHRWDWFSGPGDGTRFNWDHNYGPITWSRAGVNLLSVQSEDAHYWKAQTLDRFDGLRWIHAEAAIGSGDPVGDIPEPVRDSWNERVRFTVRGLQSKLLVGAGTVYRVDSEADIAEENDGTIRLLDDELREGDTYAVYSYIPDPSAEQMRKAPAEYPQRVVQYTWFDLPHAGQSGLQPPRITDDARSEHVTPRTIQPSFANQPLSPADVERVERSPYGRVYGLARRLAAGRPTTYDVVKSIEGYLQRELEYSEKPPPRRYPLASFLFDDKIGYCQQFSGAMALMLRMNGIPARVASGFSPGALNRRTDEYEVRDLDAHSWVEVWFSGIGWVPFDPTPSLAPASSQSASVDVPSAARGGRADLSGGAARRAREQAAPAVGAAEEEGSRAWILIVGAGLLATLGAGALWLAGVLRARPHFAATTEGAVQELRAALRRLGYSYPERTTLAELERRLRTTNGDAAAGYVARLRALRYARPGSAGPPGRHERRELRRALTSGRGLRGRLRGLVALPPHPRRRAF